MVSRILHISDLHYPTRDAEVARILADNIAELSPDVLSVTGDLANHPFIGWKAVRGWLDDVMKRLPQLKVLILPGNHDVAWKGLFSPWCWPASMMFQDIFPEWSTGVFYDKAANITYLTLDSNPHFSVSSGAEGKIHNRRLNQLRRELDDSPDAGLIRNSTKILLLHHHPFPAPFEGKDFLLHTRRGDRLIRFLAENHIDLVLHGHKHRATWSHLRLGGTEGETYFTEILGAGSAMKNTEDIDRRGHNFNLIDIAPNGIRSIRQFFKHRGAKSFEEVPASRAEGEVEHLLQSRFQMAFRMKRTAWHLKIDLEGDGENTITLEDLVFNPKAVPEYPCLKDYVDEGEALPYEAVSIAPTHYLGTLLTNSAGQRVVFQVPPDEKWPAKVKLRSYYLNSYVMNQREAAERGFGSATGDSMEYLLRDYVDTLELSVEFPGSFVYSNAVLEVLEPLQTEKVNQPLTQIFGGALQECAGKLAISLKSPPPNYSYRLRWDLPLGPPIPAGLNQANARRAQFEQAYLKYRSDPGNPVNANIDETIVVAIQTLYEALEEQVVLAMAAARSAMDPDCVDLSFFVCDRGPAKPVLRMIRWSRQGSEREFFQKFTLLIGEGNAGRAFKTGSVRIFDEAAARNDPKAHTYKAGPDGRNHKVLLSFPVLDPISQLPLGVFSVGTSDAAHADYFRALQQNNLTEIVEALKGPRADLLEEAGL